jgi:hypothetical protein
VIELNNSSSISAEHSDSKTIKIKKVRRQR